MNMTAFLNQYKPPVMPMPLTKRPPAASGVMGWNDTINDRPAPVGKVIPIGQRNSTLSHKAGQLLKRYGAEDGRALEEFKKYVAKCEQPLDAKELSTIWNSAMKFFHGVIAVSPDYLPPDQYAAQEFADDLIPEHYTDVGQAKRLAALYGDKLRYDELELDMVGDRKTALFFIISDTDATFNFLVSMAYTQLFNLLCERADDKYGGRLPVHVRCLIDEAANIGQIPNLEKLMATIRSREISACLVLQAQSQLKALYKDNMDTIIGNCDSSLFLGGKEETTLKSWSALLGKETIDMYNTSVTKGTQESHGQNFQKLGKDLMSMDELAVMDGGKCLLQVRGVRPFLSRKYDITKHPHYKYLSDFNPKNTFDIEKYLSTRLRVKPDDLFLNYEISPSELTEGNEEIDK